MFNMTRIILFIGTFLTLNYAIAQEGQMSNLDVLEYQIQKGIDEQFDEYANLKLAKKYLTAGNTRKARYFINRIDKEKIRLDPIRRFYMSLIEFVEDNHEESLRLINIEKFFDERFYPNICQLKLLNMLALPPVKEIKEELAYCRRKTNQYSDTDLMWLENIINFKLGNKKLLQGQELEKFQYILNDVDTIRVWLKIGLYLNKESIIKKYLSSIPKEFYEYNSIRELIGLIHYRTGNYDLAQSFIEDLSSPNAENIRGNIKLKNKEYELAFGHFKLALQQKKNSMNSLERILSLSWVLEQWQDGLESLENLTGNLIDQDKKRIMRTAYMMFLGKFEYADRNLHLLEKAFPNEKPYEMQLTRGFYGLSTGNKDRFFDGNESACKDFDGLSCWWLMKSFDFQYLNKTLEREETITDSLEINLTKLKTQRFKTPLNEINYIHQNDIEELDGVVLRVSDN